MTIPHRATHLLSLHRIDLRPAQSIRLVPKDAPNPTASPFQSVHFLLPAPLSKGNHEFSHYSSPCCAFRGHRPAPCPPVLPKREGTQRKACKETWGMLARKHQSAGKQGFPMFPTAESSLELNHRIPKPLRGHCDTRDALAQSLLRLRRSHGDLPLL